VQLSLIGLLLIFIGFILMVIASFSLIFEATEEVETPQSPEVIRGPEYISERKREKKYAGVIFIGPFPIVIASDKKMGIIALIVGLVIFLLAMFLIFMAGWF